VSNTEWEVTIVGGEFHPLFKSKHFYMQYMHRMLHQLKGAVPSLRGVVSCSLPYAWSVTDTVRKHDSYGEALLELDSYMEALLELDSHSQKRKRDEEHESGQENKKSRPDDATRGGDDNVFVSPNYAVDGPDKEPYAPVVCVEFDFEHPINHNNNCMDGTTWAVGDFHEDGSNPYDNLDDAYKATWQCNLKFWNEWQDKFKKRSFDGRSNVKKLWLSAIEDGSWKAAP
jgi:hypothetical protein